MKPPITTHSGPPGSWICPRRSSLKVLRPPCSRPEFTETALTPKQGKLGLGASLLNRLDRLRGIPSVAPRILKPQTDLCGVEGRKGLPRSRDAEVPKSSHDLCLPATRSWLGLPVREELPSPGWRTPIAQTHAHPHPKLTVETPSSSWISVLASSGLIWCLPIFTRLGCGRQGEPAHPPGVSRSPQERGRQSDLCICSLI